MYRNCRTVSHRTQYANNGLKTTAEVLARNSGSTHGVDVLVQWNNLEAKLFGTHLSAAEASAEDWQMGAEFS